MPLKSLILSGLVSGQHKVGQSVHGLVRDWTFALCQASFLTRREERSTEETKLRLIVKGL